MIGLGLNTIAAAMVGSFGHVGPHPLLFLADHFETYSILDHAYLRAAAHQELSAAFEEANRILEQHRAALKQVSTVLQTRGRIDEVEVALRRLQVLRENPCAHGQSSR